MVYLLGASCLDKAYNSTSNSSRKTSKKNYSHSWPELLSKKPIEFFHLLTCGYLRTRSNIIICHDIINNTITAHPSNGNTPWSTEQLISTLATYKDRLAAITYCNCFRTQTLSRDYLQVVSLLSVFKNIFYPTGRETTTGI